MKSEVGMSCTMLLTGALGMLAGFAWDMRGPGLEWIASQCGTGAAAGFLHVLHLHWSGLPGMHIGMVCAVMSAAPLLTVAKPGSYASLCLAIVRQAVCSIWMVVGMTFGAMIFEWAAAAWIGAPALNGGAVVLLGGMFAGMISGMVAHEGSIHVIKTFSRPSGLAT